MQYGLIAEEVARIYPDMVAHDNNGQVLTVKYQMLTPMLLNEVQKEHRSISDQQIQIKTQQEQIKAQAQQLRELEQRFSRLEASLGDQLNNQ
jgi:hypothetical protein